MIRLAALWIVVFGLAWYARRDWYVSLCGLILLMAVIEHPDVPKTMFGIQGLNFWNFLLAVVVYACVRARGREDLSWDMPPAITALLLAFLAVLLVSFVRMMLDRSYLDDSTTTLISEHLVNSVKWIVPGLLLFLGCRTRRRFHLALGSILGIYVLLALYVIKWMPIGLLSDGEALEQRALKILQNEIGYQRVNMSMMLAGAGWAVLATRSLAATWRMRLGIVALFLVIAYAQAVTGGRMGYVAWAAVGLGMCLIRGRSLLLLAPVVVLAVQLLVPAAGQRLLQGVDDNGASDYGGDRYGSGVDLRTITAGRTIIWPYVVARIREAPLIGYGRRAMRRTGLTTFLAQDLNEGFEHPHNAYLELLLDNGIVGFAAVMPLFLVVLALSARLYADSRSAIFVAAGGVTLAMTLSLLVAGFGSQTFYPREGAVGMWCAIGLMLRVWVERKKALAVAVPARKTAALPRLPVWPDPARGTADRRRPAARTIAPEQVGIDARLWAHG
ncbi:MAG: O-antigen ligase family protein [Acidobacteria bacterium]|nr:O-antigen ligase family protein [Acidobacteriota bacterium]